MFEEIVGSSPPLRQLLRELERVAPTDSTVLVTGETGTGKGLIAPAIHRRSPRAGQALIKVSLASMPDTLVASELFGHEKGAFTGARHSRAWRRSVPWPARPWWWSGRGGGPTCPCSPGANCTRKA